MFLTAYLVTQPICVFLCSLLVTSITIAFLFKLSFKLGLVDMPGGRKQHQNLTPLIGGIGIFIGVSTTLFSEIYTETIYLAYWASVLLLTFIGFIDDLRPLSSNIRFIVQFIALLIIILFGNTFLFNLGDLFGLGSICLGILSIPFTCFAMIGIINAVNMMDGVDGLTGCVSLVEFSLLFFLAVKLGVTHEILIITSFIGGILAFLLFNFPSRFALTRKVFLGDAGSMLLGLTLSWLCVRLTQVPNGYPPALMLWIMALPLMDTIYLIINRKARGVSALKADRDHIHHILLQLNYTPKQITLFLMSISFMIGITGVICYEYGLNDWILFYGFILNFIIYAVFSYELKKHAIGKQKIYSDVLVGSE